MAYKKEPAFLNSFGQARGSWSVLEERKADTDSGQLTKETALGVNTSNSPSVAVPPVLTLCVPVFCESVHFAGSYHVIRQALQATGLSFEAVIVDDGSHDSTWEVLRSLSASCPEIRALRFSRNFGKEAAIMACLSNARGSAVILMDGDLQHPPNLVPQMVELWKDQGYEIVDAVKATRCQESAVYRLFARVFNCVMNKCSGFDLTGASDFKLLDRKAVDALLAFPERLTFYRGLTEWIGFKHTRLAMEVQERSGGQTSWSLARLVRLALTGLLSFSTIALHLVTFLGCVFMVLALYLTILVVRNLLRGNELAGFPTLILLQLIIGSIIMISLGIIGEYLASIYNEIKRRPRFIVTEELNVMKSQDK